jgi:hypothetical protein
VRRTTKTADGMPRGLRSPMMVALRRASASGLSRPLDGAGLAMIRMQRTMAGGARAKVRFRHIFALKGRRYFNQVNAEVSFDAATAELVAMATSPQRPGLTVSVRPSRADQKERARSCSSTASVLAGTASQLGCQSPQSGMGSGCRGK